MFADRLLSHSCDREQIDKLQNTMTSLSRRKPENCPAENTNQQLEPAQKKLFIDRIRFTNSFLKITDVIAWVRACVEAYVRVKIMVILYPECSPSAYIRAVR